MWLGAPLLACVALDLVFATPVRIAGLQAPEPVFALVPAFAWAMARPSLSAPFALAVLGVASDLIWGDPPGFWALNLLAGYAVIFFARRIVAGQGFWALWGWYAAACAAAMLTGELLMGARAGHLPSVVGVALQWLITTALFPFAWRLGEAYEDTDTRF
jgi:rod shape-determining protein MreD